MLPATAAGRRHPVSQRQRRRHPRVQPLLADRDGVGRHEAAGALVEAVSRSRNRPAVPFGTRSVKDRLKRCSAAQSIATAALPSSPTGATVDTIRSFGRDPQHFLRLATA
jgi:hypothetical protein